MKCPECAQGKTVNCATIALDHDADEFVPCETTTPQPSADNDAGLEGRYHVKKINDPSGKHDDCRYFVLDPRHDVLALQTLKYYARLARRDFPALADDLDDWTRDETERLIAPRVISPAEQGGAS